MVRVGDVAVIAGDPIELPNGRAVSRAMDNRLGCYVAYEAARIVAEAGGAPGDVVAVAAVQEETTFGGSATTAYALRPDLAIVVDVTHATDAPGIDVNELGSHPFGSGPVVERGSNLNPHVFELLHDAGEAEGIPFTVAASGRHTGTDVDAMHISRGGVPCGLIGLPLRYMHSPVEMVDLADVDAAARLIAAAAQRLAADATFGR
jgi:endoglucanase